MPDAPEAWLLTAARRAAGHRERHAGVQSAAAGALQEMYEAMAERVEKEFPDERLKLLFVCAHPAIDEAVRTPLMLQTVLGVDAAQIAGAFLEKPATMGQRLVRAKAKIRDSGIGFRVPERGQLQERLGDVLNAIYGAFTIGWDMIAGGETQRHVLTGEAIFLARLVTGLLPDEAEPKGLAALMLYSEARSAARRDAEGRYVPLMSQDTALWDRAMISEAERYLGQAAALKAFGRYQTEAAIQSLQIQAVLTGRTPVRPLLQLYDVLVSQAPTMGAITARAAAYGLHENPQAGLAALDLLPASKAAIYQPWWAARAHLLKEAGDMEGARQAAAMAMHLSRDAAVRAYLAETFGLAGRPSPPTRT